MKKLIAVPLLAVLISGCEFSSQNISIEEVGSTTYLLDQKQNKAFVVQNENLIPLKRSLAASLNIGQTLSSNRTISSGRLEVETKVKYLGNKALYSANLKPVAIKKEDGEKVTTDKSNFKWFEEVTKDYDSNRGITVQLKDKDGFKLVEHSIRSSRGFIRIVGSDNEVNSYLYEGSFQVDPAIAQYASYIDIVWNL